jgi:uncharacterized membrane protein HdeD (DUF308 family)
MWPLRISRYLALSFALILAVVEALLNMSRPHWQYAPLWIIDYLIVAALLLGFWLTRKQGHVGVLMSGWALAAGVFYMALFISLDPEMNWGGSGPDAALLGLIGLGLGVQVMGFVLAAVGQFRAA